MITITPLHHPRRSLTRSSDALIHDVRADDVLDAHAQLRRLVEQDVVVDERHADPRGNRNARVGALAVTLCPSEEEGEAIYKSPKHSASADAGVLVFKVYQDLAPRPQKTINRVASVSTSRILVCLTPS